MTRLVLTIALVCAVAAPAAAQEAAKVRIRFSGAQDDTLVARDPAGAVLLATNDVPPGTPRSLSPTARLANFSEGHWELEVAVGEALALDFLASVHPVAVEASVRRGAAVEALDRFAPVKLVEGRLVRVAVAADGGVGVRHDADGDGEPETALAPAVSLRGDAANDTTPPVVASERLPDGRFALRLLDGGEDITAGGELYVSIDDGRRFAPYQGPLSIDPLLVPAIVAIGKDRAGNPSEPLTVSTQPPFCDRVARDRDALRDAIADGLAAAVAEGLLPDTDGVAVLAAGRAACLWRTGLLGSDQACAACEGVYVPGLDAIELEVFVPDAVPAASRAGAAARIAARIEEPERRLGQALVAAHARSELDAARRSLARAEGDRDAGLARQLGLLRALTTGDYVDLGAGAPDVAGPSLASLLGALQGAGIPAAEGFEAARRAELALLETDVMLRVVGMPNGVVPEAPERDTHLGRTLRRQIETAAESALTAAAGVLAASECARENELLLASRADVRDDACGGQSCRTWEALVAARAAASEAVCPGLFSAEERAAFEAYALFTGRDAASLASLLGDECTTNTSLAAALALVRRLGDRTRAAYDAALASAAAAERAQREANAAFAAGAIQDRLDLPTLDLGIELSNASPTETPELAARLYVDGARTGQERRLRLAANTRTFVLGSAARREPFFLELDARTATPNETHAALVVFDPDNAMGRARKGPRSSGFTFYLFDPADPVCPPARSPKLPADVALPAGVEP